MLVGERRIRDWRDLDAALARLAQAPGGASDPVILAADDDALHDWVMRALDSARRHGFAHVRFRK